MQINLVFEGGGVKGIAHAGALYAIETTPVLKAMGVQVMGVGGSSAGAIIAALYAAGYSGEELKSVLESTPLGGLIGSMGKVRALARFLRLKGVYSTKAIEDWLTKLLAAKGVNEVNGLGAAQDKRFGRRIPCRIVSTDVTNGRPRIYRSEEDGGKSIVKAVLQSLSIPLFFEPYSDGGSLFVDGGIVSNYPTWLFNESDFPTVGVRLRRDDPQGARHDSSIEAYLVSLLNTMLSGNDERERTSPRLREILIPADIVSSIKFKLSKAEELALFKAGEDAANRFDWTKLPSANGCVFNDPNAAVVLEKTAVKLSDVVKSAKQVTKRRYENYEESWTCLANGDGISETRFRLINDGTDPLTLVQVTIQYDEPVGVSFDDLKFEVQVNPSDCRLLVLPLENKSEVKEFALWFIPPISAKEYRDVHVTVSIPKWFRLVPQTRKTTVAWELGHENGIQRAHLELKVAESLGRPEVLGEYASKGSKGIVTNPTAGDKFYRVTWELADLDTPLDVKANLILR